MDSKRALKSRQIFNEFSKTERTKWLNRKQIKAKTKLESQQSHQIREISAQLAKLKQEYNNSIKTVGMAHKSAIVVQSSDNRVIECEQRRYADVMNRAKHALIAHQKTNIDKQHALKCSKLKAIETRKQLMKSRVDKNIVDDNGKSIIRQMRKLESDEKRLRKLIDERLKQISDSETTVEKHSESHPQTSKQPILKSKRTNSEPIVMKNTDIKQIYDIKLKNDAMIQTDDNSQTDLISNIEKTANFALKLYEKLKSRGTVVRPKKVFRNIAVNTTPTKLSDRSITIENNADSTISSETSFLSLPKLQPHFLLETRKLTNIKRLDISAPMVSELTQLPDRSIEFHESSKDNVSSFTNNDNNDDLDPLLDRIQRLRCLIDEKVCKNSGLNVLQNEITVNDSNMLLTDDNEPNISTQSSSAIFHKLSTIIEAENENTSADINSTKIGSIKGSVSTETHKVFDSESFKPINSSNTLQASLPSFSLSNETSFGSLSKFSENEFDINRQNETLESFNLSDTLSDIESISKSGLNSRLHSLPNRNIFWKEVFEMTGKTVAEPDIENILKNSLQTDEDFETSANVSAFKRRHSTPKCHSLNRFYGTLDDLEITFPDN